MIFANCHQDKKHYAKGLCYKCYSKMHRKRPHIVEYRKARSKTDKEKQYIKNWYLKNKDKYAISARKYKASDQGKKTMRERIKFRRKTDFDLRLKERLRDRVLKALKRNRKAGSTVKDLGCSIDQLKQHLESKFQPGMTWSNWSRTGWHIDHIIPLASFDLTDRAQFTKACHYTNLQPLWAYDNLSKGDKHG